MCLLGVRRSPPGQNNMEAQEDCVRGATVWGYPSSLSKLPGSSKLTPDFTLDYFEFLYI